VGLDRDLSGFCDVFTNRSIGLLYFRYKQISMRFITLLCFFCSAIASWSQAPALIPYQAVARDAAGLPLVNANVNARFTIHNNTPAGEVVWQETQSVNTTDQGLFAIQLGSIVSLSSVDWGTGDKFMQVELELGSGFVDFGTQQLLSVPYALYSSNSHLSENGFADVSSIGDTLYLTNGEHIIVPGISQANAPLQGCTDPNSGNYNPNAVIDDSTCCAGAHYSIDSPFPVMWYAYSEDGSFSLYGNTNEINEFCLDAGCIYFGVYNEIPPAYPFNIQLLRNNEFFGEITYDPWYGDASIFIEENAIPGCFDLTACNYDSLANCPDYSLCNYDCYGCTDSSACNYSPVAYIENSTCIYRGDNCDDGNVHTFEDRWREDCVCLGDSIIGTPHTCGAPFVHNPNLIYGTMTDQEGNSYKTIVIGTQEWMAENLKTSKYRNGDLISPGSWVYYNNDPNYECPFGKLYTWYTCVDSRQLCPTGWHIPTQNEWGTLASSVGGTDNGLKMKSTGTVESLNGYWNSSGYGASNSSGFSGLPGGARITEFALYGTNGYFWSSTDAYGPPVNQAWANYLFNLNNSFISTTESKGFAFSVRCVRD
jgi:uncharacterized protein (TIGR02145 family)